MSEDYIEIQTFGMVRTDDGATLADSFGPNIEPEFYDVMVTRRNDDTGEVHVLEEFEELSGERAAEIERRMEAVYGVIACEVV